MSARKASTMAVIKISVPKTPKSAFNKDRPASGLLIAQLEHLETAAGNYPSKAKKRKKQLTEGQVGARIAQQPGPPGARGAPLRPQSTEESRSVNARAQCPQARLTHASHHHHRVRA